jgi:hypothetical protein
MKNITEVGIGQEIIWQLNKEGVELSDSDINYIQERLNKVFTEGQLCVEYGDELEETATGYWKLLDWKSKAEELQNEKDEMIEVLKEVSQFFVIIPENEGSLKYEILRAHPHIIKTLNKVSAILDNAEASK